MAKKFKKETLKLKERHAWRAKPGYKIFVVDHGAVRFDIPRDWIIEPGAESTKFYDGEPPNDDCRLEVSYLRLPPIDWSGLPLSELIRVATEGDHRNITPTGKFVHQHREYVELAWAEFRFMDPQEHREAFTRLCIGRGSGVQALITLDYWPEDAARVDGVWDEVLRSLALGRYVADPTVGL